MANMKIYSLTLVVLSILTLLQGNTATAEQIPNIKEYPTVTDFLKSDACQKNQLMLNYCNSEVSNFYDYKLEALYKRLPNSKEVRDAQSAWLKFRDAECQRVAAGSYEGSIYGLLIEECKGSLTKRRIAIFETELNCKKDGGCGYLP